MANEIGYIPVTNRTTMNIRIREQFAAVKAGAGVRLFRLTPLLYWIGTGLLPPFALWLAHGAKAYDIARLYPHFFLHPLLAGYVLVTCLCGLLEKLRFRKRTLKSMLILAMLATLSHAYNEEASPHHGFWKFKTSVLSQQTEGASTFDRIRSAEANSAQEWKALEANPASFGLLRYLMLVPFCAEAFCFSFSFLCVVAFAGSFYQRGSGNIQTDTASFVYLFGLLLCAALWVPMRVACEVEKARILHEGVNLTSAGLLPISLVISIATFFSAAVAIERRHILCALGGCVLIAALLGMQFSPTLCVDTFGMGANGVMYFTYAAILHGGLFWSAAPSEDFHHNLPMPTPLRAKHVFISYSHSDNEWLERVNTHLVPLVRENQIEVWNDRQIAAGAKWKEEVDKALHRSVAAILLVSAKFIASDFITYKELPILLEKAEKDGLVILPLIVSPCLFARTPLAQFQAVNDPARPLLSLPLDEQEKILVKLTLDVEKALKGSSP